MRESIIIIIQSKPSHNFTIFQLQQLPPKQNHLTSTSLSPSLFLFLTQAHAHKHSFTRTSSQREIPADPIVPRQIQLISPPYRNAISGHPRSPTSSLSIFASLYITLFFVVFCFLGLWIFGFHFCECSAFFFLGVDLSFLPSFGSLWYSNQIYSLFLDLLFVFCSKCSFLCTSKFCFLLQSTFSPT